MPISKGKRTAHHALSQYIFFSTSSDKALTVYSKTNHSRRSSRLRHSIPISGALAPGASPFPTWAVHATRIIANGEVYCEHAGVWISRFVTQISTGSHANTRSVLAAGTFITVCSRCAENASYEMRELLARRKMEWLMGRELFVPST